MSISLQSLLPTLLVASPLLIGAAPSSTPDAVQQVCASGDESALSGTSDASVGHVVHPIRYSQQALITTRHEWMSVDATPIQTHCVTKEEPTEEVAPQADEAAGEIPDLDGSSVPDSVPEATDVSEPEATEQDITEPAAAEPEAAEPEAVDSETTEPEASETDAIEPSPTAAPIPARTVAPPPSDPALDPGNFTPADDSPTPFDGSVVSTLESLPDGSYRYLAGDFEYGNYTNEQLVTNGGAVFLLTKVGNAVTGNLSTQFGQPGVCVTGTLSGNTITGTAYPNATDDADMPENVGDSFVPYGSSALQVRQPQEAGSRTYYADALLDLSNFSQINAGTALAPTECNEPPSASISSDEEVDTDEAL